MRKVWDIPGGVHPPENKTQSNASPIARIPLPSQLVVPLNQHIGAPCAPIVEIGQKVLKGEKIADAQGYVSTAAHAPTSGTVVAIEQRNIPHPSGLSALCVVIEPDRQDTWRSKHPNENWQSNEPKALLEIIRDAGIAGMGGAGFPTSVKLKPRGDQQIDTLILNGTECEPYITADDVLMREYADEIIAGTEILAHILNQPKTILIGVEDNKPEAAAAMEKAAEKSELAIEVVTFPTKYPSGGEKQLIQILTGKEVPSGKLPADIGMVLQNIGTAQAVFRAVCKDEPLISRITTVVGESLGLQRNIEVLIGTPLEHILALHDFDAQECERLIVGGPMMGFAVQSTDVPVIKTTNCILAPSKTELPAALPQQACIRCGMCSEACPVSLLPQQLYWFSRSEDFDKLRSHNLFDCIECGACSYVCPSNIPLVQYYRASKGAIKLHDEEKRKAEHSRQRFEFRQERLEKAAAEKEAKRLERKKKAELAKAKADEVKATPQPVKETVKKESSSSNAPTSDEQAAKTLAKLQRTLSSAESRLERAQKALQSAEEEGSDAARLETLSARIKDAEQKVADAKQRLEAETSTSSHSGESQKNATEKVISKKLSVSPLEKLQQNVETLKKRLATAQQKAAEAERDASPTLSALQSGVDKLKQKLDAAEQELSVLAENASDGTSTQAPKPEEQNAADAAIEKAKKRAEELAAMSPEEKAMAQIASLNKRLEKAKSRLAKAEKEGDENIDAFRLAVEKIESKIEETTA